MVMKAPYLTSVSVFKNTPYIINNLASLQAIEYIDIYLNKPIATFGLIN